MGLKVAINRSVNELTALIDVLNSYRALHNYHFATEAVWLF